MGLFMRTSNAESRGDRTRDQVEHCKRDKGMPIAHLQSAGLKPREFGAPDQDGLHQNLAQGGRSNSAATWVNLSTLNLDVQRKFSRLKLTRGLECGHTVYPYSIESDL